LAIKLAVIIEDFVSIVLLPLYFAASGLRTELQSINSVTAFLMLIMVLVVATVGKTLGCALAARFMKLDWRDSITIGVLMNCRGKPPVQARAYGFRC
jgi:Kef-type K+ transport system membrane component KefB